MKVSLIIKREDVAKIIIKQLDLYGIDFSVNEAFSGSDGESIVISDAENVSWADIGVGENYRGNAMYVVYEPEDITLSLINKVYLRKNKLPATIFDTERLIVREMSLKDLDACYKLYETLKDCPFVEPLYEREREEEFISNYIDNMYGFFDYGLWLCFLKETGELVARIGIENRTIDDENVQELGYLVSKEWQGKGIAYEACEGVLEYAKNTLELPCIYCCIEKNNIPSINLAAKLGFKLEAESTDGMLIYKYNFN